MPANAQSAQEPQSAGAVLMVRPARFGFNPQTTASNEFQQQPLSAGEAAAERLVQSEFDGLAKALRAIRRYAGSITANTSAYVLGLGIWVAYLTARDTHPTGAY